MTYAPPLSEQVILITGASTGIGAALAQLLAARALGIRLVLAARSQDKLEQVAPFAAKLVQMSWSSLQIWLKSSRSNP